LPKIESGEDLLDFFWFCGLQKGEHKVNVSTRVRKEVLLGDRQGRVTVNNGCVVDIAWKNLGGGIWQASVLVE